MAMYWKQRLAPLARGRRVIAYARLSSSAKLIICEGNS